jgi:hypothetical protein
MHPVACTLSPGAELPPCGDKLLALYRYWLAIRPAPDLVPGRQHFDPVAVPQLLSALWMLDVQRAPLRFKYRLLGTDHVAAMDGDMTGRWLDELFPEFTAEPNYSQCVATVEERQVCFYKGRPLYHVRKEYLAMERLMLPLARNGRDVDVLLAITVYDIGRRPGQSG